MFSSNKEKFIKHYNNISNIKYEKTRYFVLDNFQTKKGPWVSFSFYTISPKLEDVFARI